MDAGYAIKICSAGKRNRMAETVVAVATVLVLVGCTAQPDTRQAQIESQITSQQQEIERQARDIEQLKALLTQETETRRRRPARKHLPIAHSQRFTSGGAPISQQQETERQRLRIEELSE